ncbi:prephenate dehydrogenase [Stratiformator vulcanicus]|uniref:Prephenate dehydrogenase n=1 Tax=Stratiformator vulcanicus TaxID=2527980 RepID=A0A517R2S3_9PLAN|nr:prephenate dehydrogenase/arogenate dehydrogenase family protein [Stratiformator vulcanicus]QDT38151.1 prephenate dehydrogenase [Stratiformator vulcanicus]
MHQNRSGSPGDPSQHIPTDGVVAIVGVGLIGGSIAAAIKAHHPGWTVVGFGRDPGRLDEAREAGLIDVAQEIDGPPTDPQADFAVVCTPVGRIAQDVRAIARHCRDGAVITDGGSVKATICRDAAGSLERGIEFVGSHPLAGSEKQGWRHASASLFQQKTCVVTPTAENSESAVSMVESFWRSLGANVASMSPQDHDRILALTSHLPHVTASALAGLIQAGDFDAFAGTGFRDTTRVAAGDAELWTQIFIANQKEVTAALDRFSEQLSRFRSAIEQQDSQAISDMLAAAAAARKRLDHECD